MSIQNLALLGVICCLVIGCIVLYQKNCHLTVQLARNAQCLSIYRANYQLWRGLFERVVDGTNTKRKALGKYGE